MVQSQFMSLQNLQDLVSVFEKFLLEKHQLSEHEVNELKLNRLFLQAMETAWGAQENRAKPLPVLNKQVLTAVKNYVLREMLPKHSQNAMNAISREVSTRGPMQVQNREMQPASLSSGRLEEKTVKRFLESREKEHEVRVPEHIKQGLPSEKIGAMQSDELEKRLQELQTKRDVPIFDEKPSERVFADLNLPKQEAPHEIYRKNIAQNEAAQDRYDQENPVVEDMSMLRQTFITRAPEKMRTKTKYLLVNTSDRDWVTNRHRYRFKINFTYVDDRHEKTPYYANNPTIPFTKTVSSAGIPNTTGWYDTGGVFHPAYDGGAPRGELLGYEETIYYTDKSATLQEPIRNVRRIRVVNVIVPTTVSDLSAESGPGTHGFNLNFPYLLLHIDQFNDVYDGTSDAIRRAFSQLVYDSHFYTPNGRGYIKLYPVQQESKEFYPTALTTIPSLTFSIKKPNGELMSDDCDGHDICRVQYEPYNPCFLQVITTTYWKKDCYFKGDYVRLKNFQIYKFSEEADQGAIDAINAFITRPEGHEITEIGQSNELGYYRSFYIKAPGTFDEKNGVFVTSEAWIAELTRYYDQPCFPEDAANGMVMNMSTQISISMTIDTDDYDAYELESKRA